MLDTIAAKSVRPLPLELEEIDADWLTAALFAKTPAARVDSFEIVDIRRGFTTLIRLRLHLNAAGRAATTTQVRAAALEDSLPRSACLERVQSVPHHPLDGKRASRPVEGSCGRTFLAPRTPPAKERIAAGPGKCRLISTAQCAAPAPRACLERACTQ